MKLLHSRIFLFAVMALLLIATGLVQSWSVVTTILNLCLISAIMSLGVNIQWGYAGLVNFGVMGFCAVGGMAVVLVAEPPVGAAWSAGGRGIAISAFIVAVAIAACLVVARKLKLRTRLKQLVLAAIIMIAIFLLKQVFGPATEAIEAVDPSLSGYLGGLGLPILASWIVAPVLAAGVAWLVGKAALGLRTDYLAIATFGISEILVTLVRNEDWLTRGVKNVVGLPRPAPYEIDLQQAIWFQHLAAGLGQPVDGFSTIFVKLCFAALFIPVLALLMWLSESALNSPWGRMMRAVRDNEVAANAMGKDIKKIHLTVFVLGAAVIGLGGAMLVTLDGQFTPSSYQPQRFTFLIWIMMIIGGSGNNWGAVLGGFLIWFCWVEAEPAGVWLLDLLTRGLGEQSELRHHLLANASQMRLVVMGVVLLVVLRFMPRGLIPEKRGQSFSD
ncbi:MAG: branched-chain amino acid ABC transporter permease [Salaquimonas sp.]|nr:branched-chain amino acid ABC transporter permease [Salaquimonas sp.]